MKRKIRQVSECCNSKYDRLKFDKEWGDRYVCKICGELCIIKRISIKDETKDGGDKL